MIDRKNLELQLIELKKEETELLEILSEVRKQLNRYKIEELHLSSVLLAQDESDESETEVVKEEELREIAIKLDCVESINQTELDLDVDKKLDEGFVMEEDEESD